MAKRIFVSLPADTWLEESENKTKWAIVEAVEKLGYTTELFLDTRGTDSIAGSQAWSADACERVMRHCEGCVLLGFARWRISVLGKEVLLPTEFNHYEGAVAYTLGLPLLVFVEKGLRRRVVFNSSYKGHVGEIPTRARPEWLATKAFLTPFAFWRRELQQRRDVFLGYCGASVDVAAKVKKFASDSLGLSVLDWRTDFAPATSILQQIQEAAARCRAAIFIFTKDDVLANPESQKQAAPRDNVVFEAGYFISLKGKAKVLVVLESDAKMPADLGGDIYAFLENRKTIRSIKPALQKFATSI